MDSYQEVHLTVTDAPLIPKTVSPKRGVSTNLPNISVTSSNNPTTIHNVSGTSPNLSMTFLTPGDISGHSSLSADPSLDSSGAGLHESANRTNRLVWTGGGLVVMVTVTGLVLFLVKRRRRTTTSQPPASPKTDCLYEEIREADGQTETLPVVVSSSSTTNPADTNCPQDDLHPSYSTVDFHKDHMNPIYNLADYPGSVIYSSV
ncbi:uncharacterized protein LOC105029365 [Esox lucius]|uniref:uncharacterized protein LOC105029365 n=1 Tax=Esox lucius TaxID=8010 RepID=UPI001476C19E|nr:uncharacterized protein LOC105029365 [Esox lucius]